MLRQVAVLLERENDKLHAKLQALTAELARLRGAARPAVELELEFLKELLAQRDRALFGASSEQRPRPMPEAPPPPAAPRRGHGPTAPPHPPPAAVGHEPAAAGPTRPPPRAAPRRGHGPTGQPHLPTVEVVHELAAADQTCPQCGGTLKEMPGQTEDAEEITAVGRGFVPVQHRRRE